jgi:hypothetical protein
MSSSSSSSASSVTESSSADYILTGESDLVFLDPMRNATRAVWSASLDLDAIDYCKVRSTVWHFIDMSGTYAGYTYRTASVKVDDNARFYLIITPRLGGNAERAIFEEWREVLLSSVRAAMIAIRQEYAVAQCPQCELRGRKV